MPKRVKVPNDDAARDPKRKICPYAVLYHVNEGFKQILAQFQQLGNTGAWRPVSKRLQLIMEETRAEVNFELVEILQERELKEWTRLGGRNASMHRVGTKMGTLVWRDFDGLTNQQHPRLSLVAPSIQTGQKIKSKHNIWSLL